MNKKSLQRACVLVLFSLLFSHQLAFAHESITIGNYELEIGWLEEPPIAGQQNAVVVTVSERSSGEALPVDDVSSLEINISYGGQNKVLGFQPFGDDSPGQFIAPILPTVPGEYTIILGGQLGGTGIDAEVRPEEVQPADVIQFPRLESSEQEANSGTGDWLTWFAVLLGLLGVGLGITAHRKAR